MQLQAVYTVSLDMLRATVLICTKIADTRYMVRHNNFCDQDSQLLYDNGILIFETSYSMIAHNITFRVEKFFYTILFTTSNQHNSFPLIKHTLKA